MKNQNHQQNENAEKEYNLRILTDLRAVPEEAKSSIEGSKLTSINNAWRIYKLTEEFGPCGQGWTYDIEKQWAFQVPESREVKVFTNIRLYYKTSPDGPWLPEKGIPGTGGHTLVFSNGECNDDAYKSALTDAISVAAKALGLGYDVYFNTDESKYGKKVEPSGETEEKSVPEEEPELSGNTSLSDECFDNQPEQTVPDNSNMNIETPEQTAAIETEPIETAVSADDGEKTETVSPQPPFTKPASKEPAPSTKPVQNSVQKPAKEVVCGKEFSVPETREEALKFVLNIGKYKDNPQPLCNLAVLDPNIINFIKSDAFKPNYDYAKALKTAVNLL